VTKNATKKMKELTVYIFDVEGTLSDHSHRLHLVPKVATGKKSDWFEFQDEFVNDPPIMQTISLLKQLAKDNYIVISTGMAKRMRKPLEKWLYSHGINPNLVLMRENHHGNLTSPEVKKRHLDEMAQKLNGMFDEDLLIHIKGAFDDRLDVCEMFHKENIEAFHLPFKGFVSAKRIKKPDQSLGELADLYRQRNAIYKDTYKRHGHVMDALFPDGLDIEGVKDFNRLALLDMMIGKLTRYTNNFDKGGHEDSLDDLSVYTQMLKEIDQGD
jgi:hypothetical protein